MKASSAHATLRRSGGHRRRGATLIEALMAITLLATGYAGLTTANSTCLGMLRRQRETVAASQLLQERLEQAQLADWGLLTSVNGLTGQMLNTASPQAQYLPTVHETITINGYPATVPAATPLKVERLADGTVNVLSTPPVGLSLRQCIALRVDVRVDWVSNQNRQSRSREMSTVIALGGLLR